MPQIAKKASAKKDSTAYLSFEATLWIAADKLRNNMVSQSTLYRQYDFMDSEPTNCLTNFVWNIADSVYECGKYCRVSRETLPLNRAIARTEREISFMQEFRTRLTADVVIGKFEVRNTQKPSTETAPLADGNDESDVEEFVPGAA